MNKILLSFASTLVVLGLTTGQALAWSFSMNGTGKCVPDGSYQITWNVNNPENEPLTVQKSSDPSVVPVNTQVAAKDTKSFTQTVDGTKPGEYRLKLNVNWPSDQALKEQMANVKLDEACAQPSTPPVTTRSTQVEPKVLSSAASAPQVAQVPVGSVNAGEGSKTVMYTALFGLIASIITVLVGMKRLVLRQNS